MTRPSRKREDGTVERYDPARGGWYVPQDAEPEKAERNREILEKHLEGVGRHALAEEYHITVGRISEIIANQKAKASKASAVASAPSRPAEGPMTAEEADAEMYRMIDEQAQARASGGHSEPPEREEPKEALGWSQNPTSEELDELLR